MKRIQGSFGARDPEEEKRRTRESVLSNLLMFGIIVGIIRAGKLLMIEIYVDNIKNNSFFLQLRSS